MRVATWNVNSIAVRMPRVLELLEAHRPDVVCVQETRATLTTFPHLELAGAGYVAVEHGTSGRNGVAVLARLELDVTRARAGLPGEPEPGDARWVEADVGGVRVASVYVPNGRRVGSPEFAAKLVFLEAMADHAADLAESGPTIVAGDVNVCASDADAWDIAALHGGTHATPQERERLAAMTEVGFVDAYRALHPHEPGFTWWDYRAGAFHRGMGLRIDQILLGGGLEQRLTDAWVDRDRRKGSKPSDHAPLIATLEGDAA